MSQKLRGFVGQSMRGQRSYRDAKLGVIGAVDVSSGSSSITTTAYCQALIYAFGPGGSGESANGLPAGGAGSGAALFKRMRLAPGQTISCTVGTPGASATAAVGNDATDTTVTVLGQTLRAGGGKGGGGVTTAVGGKGGVASGGDINRSGGDGGSASAAGASATPGGGAGGAPISNSGGGAGGAGFGDDAAVLIGGAGSAGSTTPGSFAGGAPGGGSGSNINAGATGVGGAGRVYILLLRAT